MQQYLDMLQDVMDNGHPASNRTGVDTTFKFGNMVKYDLSDGFPIVTTKQFPFKTCVGEMLGFIRAVDNAKDFRNLGCKFWDQNANENKDWLANPARKGTDDLGSIYGYQARFWESPYAPVGSTIDQLKLVVDDLSNGIDNRREIVTHWNPAALSKMALAPCHVFYQFAIRGEHIDMLMYQRSCDLFLGVPFNISGYSWLLSVISHITGHKAGVFTHTLGNYHIYDNHISQVNTQLSRTPHSLPTLEIDPSIKTLEDLETWVIPDNFHLTNYTHDGKIVAQMAV